MEHGWATPWMAVDFGGLMGNPGSVMAAVTLGGSWSYFAMATWAAGASSFGHQLSRFDRPRNAAAVFGCCSVHAWVATYPSMGKFTIPT